MIVGCSFVPVIDFDSFYRGGFAILLLAKKLLLWSEKLFLSFVFFLFDYRDFVLLV